ncbi:MAG: hypothetical protein ACOCX1_00965 [Fimbriimonadaceae bacterium]
MRDRINAQGVPRDELYWVMNQSRFVRTARKIDRCLLCCAKGVNEAGLCDNCYTLLDEKELELAERWLSGVGP